MAIVRRQLLRVIGAGAVAAVLPRRAFALDYPTRPVRLIVPFPPGGAADITARLMAQFLQERLGQPFVIENKPGAGSNLGTEAVVTAPPDGYTLLLINAGNAINATLYSKLNFNFIRDIVPVGSIVQAPHVMFVTPSLPPRTVAEFIAYAKSNPGKVNYASAGVGNANHIAAEMFKMMTGVDMVHVPYRGGAPAVLDVVAGQVQVIFADTLTAGEQLKAGRLRALAVATPARSPVLPDTPPISDTVPGFDASSWWGIGAPRGTPGEIVARLNDGINAGLADPKLRSRFAAMGALILGGSPADFGKLIADETEKWARSSNSRPSRPSEFANLATSGRGAARPKPRRGDPGAFDQRVDLCPRDLRIDLVAGRGRRKAAVVAGEHAVAADDTRVTLDPLRHELGVLDKLHAMRHHARNEDDVVGELRLLPHRPFMLMARIGCLERERLCVDAQHQVDVVPQLHVVDARRDVDAVAGVEANALARDALERQIDRLDMRRDELAALLDRGVGGAVVMRRHARIVDLQHEASVDDGAVFDVHGVGQRFEVLLVGRIESVAMIEFEVVRRDRRHEYVRGLRLRRLQGVLHVAMSVATSFWPT